MLCSAWELLTDLGFSIANQQGVLVGAEATVSIPKTFGHDESTGNHNNDGHDEAEEGRRGEGKEDEVLAAAAGLRTVIRQVIGSGGSRDGRGRGSDKLRNAARGLAFLRPPELPAGASSGRLLPLAKGQERHGSPGSRELCTAELQRVGFETPCAFPLQAPDSLLDPPALGGLLSSPEEQEDEEGGKDWKGEPRGRILDARAESRGGASMSSLVCPSIIRGGCAVSAASPTAQVECPYQSEQE